MELLRNIINGKKKINISIPLKLKKIMVKMKKLIVDYQILNIMYKNIITQELFDFNKKKY